MQGAIGASWNRPHATNAASAPNAKGIWRATAGYALPEADIGRLVVYDVLGREVAVLADGPFEAGQHEVAFDAVGLAPGTYLVRMTPDGGFVRGGMGGGHP